MNAQHGVEAFNEFVTTVDAEIARLKDELARATADKDAAQAKLDSIWNRFAPMEAPANDLFRAIDCLRIVTAFLVIEGRRRRLNVREWEMIEAATDALGEPALSMIAPWHNRIEPALKLP